MQRDGYANRWVKLMADLPDHSLVWMRSAKEVMRNGDAAYPFRQCSHFLHLTGWQHPFGEFLLYKAQDKVLSFWGCDPVSADRALWEGHYLGPKQAASAMGFDQGDDLAAFAKHFSDYLAKAEHVFTLASEADAIPKDKYRPLERAIAKMRLIKDKEALECMERACAITLKAHRAVEDACAPGIAERALRGVFLSSILEQGADAEAYGSIVASGANACVLHYHDLTSICQEGDLLLIDAGAEVAGYAADITRTYPVSGKWMGAQKAVHQAVVHAQTSVIEAIKPGVTWSALNRIAATVLVEALIDLDCLQGSVATLVDSKAYRPYFPHGVGHWLGLDVHDDCPYENEDNTPVVFKQNMVLTVEPGLYFHPHDERIPKALRGIGVRVEDDVVVTASGSVKLGFGDV